MSNQHFSLAIGIGSKNKKNQWLEVFYPLPILNPAQEILSSISQLTNYKGGNQYIELDNKTLHAFEEQLMNIGQVELSHITRAMEESDQHCVITILETDDVPSSTPEAYLKLHLLSHRLVKPHGTNLQGIFPLLPNVAWTSEGAIDLEELSMRQLKARAEGRVLSINSVDKFPKMSDYVIPSGVRIANTARIRLGAYIGEGTTVMHEGFVNFNAGTAGKKYDRRSSIRWRYGRRRIRSRWRVQHYGNPFGG